MTVNRHPPDDMILPIAPFPLSGDSPYDPPLNRERPSQPLLVFPSIVRGDELRPITDGARVIALTLYAGRRAQKLDVGIREIEDPVVGRCVAHHRSVMDLVGIDEVVSVCVRVES